MKLLEKVIHRIPAKNPEDIEKNVCIYCRVSTASKEQLYSLGSQISTLTRQVSHVKQWRLVDVFIDVTSAKNTSNRQEFERMLQACEEEQISIILTKSISRFGRDTVDTLAALERIKKAGTRVIFDEEHLDTSKADSELLISIIESLSQAENESRSDNIRRGLTMRSATGSSRLYKRKAYGYKQSEKGELVIDEEQARVVRNIYRWYLDGMSVVGIIKKLQDEGIPSPTGKEKWSKRSIDKMLKNEKYMGIVTLEDSLVPGQKYRMTEANPPIITESEFQAVQEAREKRSNVVRDEDGTVHKKSTKYSSKRKIRCLMA